MITSQFRQCQRTERSDLIGAHTFTHEIVITFSRMGIWHSREWEFSKLGVTDPLDEIFLDLFDEHHPFGNARCVLFLLFLSLLFLLLAPVDPTIQALRTL